jgi:tRNA threonylcarbamoyladenosine biosynthesis protein TsaE
MHEKIFTTHHRSDLINPIDDLISNIKKPLEEGGVIIFLNGQLGSGKTAFVQELAYSLGVESRVQSPTFVLMKKYSIDSAVIPELYTLIHIDAYRLEPHHKEALNVEDFLSESGTLVLIEWPTSIDLGQELAFANIDFEIMPNFKKNKSNDNEQYDQDGEYANYDETEDDNDEARKIKIRYKK